MKDNYYKEHTSTDKKTNQGISKKELRNIVSMFSNKSKKKLLKKLN